MTQKELENLNIQEIFELGKLSEIVNPFIFSSAKWFAFDLGEFFNFMKWSGETVWNSRGYSMRGRSGRTFKYNFKKERWDVK